MKRDLAAVFLTTLLTGCSLAPGHKMEDPPPNVPGVKIRPITAELLSEQRVNENLEAAQPSAPKGLPSAKGHQYRIGPHDVLGIIVWGHPDLTIPAGQLRGEGAAAGHLVAQNGTIFFPYVGTVKVAGKTVVEAREILTQKIARTLVVDPQVDMRVVAYRSQKTYVVGEVKQPGRVPVTDVPLTVIEAINRAGGLTADADLLHVTLARDGNVYDIDLAAMYKEGSTTQNGLLKDGDLLRIPNRNQQKIFVLGEVAKPASLIMKKTGGMTLTEAISDAGGLDRITSWPAQIYVIRGTPDEAEIYHLSSRSPDALILGEQFQLKVRDVVYVETAPVTRWNRVIEQILPTVRGLTTID